MGGCQSGFHDHKLQKRLVKVPVEVGGQVILGIVPQFLNELTAAMTEENPLFEQRLNNA